MKHPFKIITLTLAALVMLAYATHAYGQSHDVPSVSPSPSLFLAAESSISRSITTKILVKTMETKRFWLFMDSPIPERRLSY